jgi:hypothetical protein
MGDRDGLFGPLTPGIAGEGNAGRTPAPDTFSGTAKGHPQAPLGLRTSWRQPSARVASTGIIAAILKQPTIEKILNH